MGDSGTTDRKNVFVIGLDAHNRQVLEAGPDAAQYQFHQVLSFAEIYGEVISFDDALASAQRVLDSFDGPIDAIIGFWDFPVSSLVPLLRKRFGLAPTVLRMW